MRKLRICMVALPMLGGLLCAALEVTHEFAKERDHGFLKGSQKTGLISISSDQSFNDAKTVQTGRWTPRLHPTRREDGTNKHTVAKTHKLPGIFRGDWGELPVYAKNDRVNYEGAAYLSLLDVNQNQPPSLSKAYWRIVKQAVKNNTEACYSPAPAVNLSECDFTENRSLKDMNLAGANLRNSRLAGDLGSADLTGADLSGASTIGALMINPETRLARANLSGLQSDGNNPLVAESADMADTNFANAKLYGAKMRDTDLSRANFSGATLTGSDLSASRFENADLNQSNLTYANLADTSFVQANLKQADLSEADLTGADLSSADFQQANFANADFTRVDFSGADLSGANLSGAKNAESALFDSRTRFTGAICPDGITADGISVITCLGHGF